MWCHHLFSQRNKTTERGEGWELKMTWKGGVRKNLKKGG